MDEFDGLRAYVTPKQRAMEIIERVATEHNLSPTVLLSRDKKKNVYAARFQAIWEVRQLRSKVRNRHLFTTPQLGHLFGGRDHSTICHALRRWAEMNDLDMEAA